MTEEKHKKVQEKKIEEKEETLSSGVKLKKEEQIKTEEKIEETGEEKHVHKEKEKLKKTEAVVNAYGVHVSTKQSMAICRFIKNKKIHDAISDLEQVVRMKKAVPMKGEIPHRKGKGMMSGRFPKAASGEFIKILKSLSANANYNDVEEPIIVEAVANIGSRPYGRFGTVRKKRTHIIVVAKSKPIKK